MSPEKKRWVIFTVLSLSIAIGVGVLIYLQKQEIGGWEQESDRLRTEITSSQNLIQGTPDLVKEVIIQRETDAVIKGILSDEEDVNNFVRTLQAFEEASGVSITSMKPQRESARNGKSEEFNRVAYTLVLEADAFEFLEFLDEVESHNRLMSTTSFKLTSGGRNLSRTRDGEIPRHKVTLDLETYVYKPKSGTTEVNIDQYDRKRGALIGEISRRAQELQVPRYEFRGRRNRRDPWIDPRIPAESEGPTIEEQIAIVAELTDKAHEAELLWLEVEKADNVIQEMKARAALEAILAELDEEIRRVQSSGALSYIPADRRFQGKVVAVASELRARMEKSAGAQQGPSLAALEEAANSMRRHIDRGEYEMAKDVYETLGPRLQVAERSELKRPVVEALHELSRLVDTVLEFERIDMTITGIAIYEGYRPVALINGDSVSEGELIGEELIVRHIESDRIEFDYRGVLLARPVDGDNDPQSSPQGTRGGK